MQEGIPVLLRNHMMWAQEDPRIEGWLPWHYQSGPHGYGSVRCLDSNQPWTPAAQPSLCLAS